MLTLVVCSREEAGGGVKRSKEVASDEEGSRVRQWESRAQCV